MKNVFRGTGPIPESWYRPHTRKDVLLVPAPYPNPPFSVVPAPYLPFKSKPYRGGYPSQARAIGETLRNDPDVPVLQLRE
jgi:hypothetical protein